MKKLLNKIKLQMKLLTKKKPILRKIKKITLKKQNTKKNNVSIIKEA